MIKMDCPQNQIDRRGPFRRPSCFIVRQTKFVFKLEQEFDGSNPYMKYGRNPIKDD